MTDIVRSKIVLIDGRSGSGKTQLSLALQAVHPPFQILHLDQFYPGWDGLLEGSAMLPTVIETGRWQEWKWPEDRLGPWHQFDLDRPLIIEGAGALSRATAPLADLRIWVQHPDDDRKVRALRRDGDWFAPHWDRWAAQEESYIARENPRSLADVIVDGLDVAAAVGDLQWDA